MSNLFDKTRKAVVSGSTVTSTKPVEAVAKAGPYKVWMTVDTDADGNAVIVCKSDNPALPIRRWSTVDATEAELLFNQLANDYLFDRKEFR